MNAVIPDAGFHHVAVRTTDYERSLSYYRDLLGMAVAAAWSAPDGRQLALLDIGDGSCVELIGAAAGAAAPEGQAGAPYLHLAIRTSDPDVVWQRATAAGYESVVDPKDVQLGEMQARIAFFKGPNDEVIELFSPRA